MFSRREALRQLAAGAAWAAMPGVAASRVLGANDRIRFGLIGAGEPRSGHFPRRPALPERRGRCRGRSLHAPLGRGQGRCPGGHDAPGFPPSSGRQVDRCGPYRHPATPARAELRARDPGRQRRVSREDHGLQSRPRPADAQGVCRLGTGGPGGHADEHRAEHCQDPGVDQVRSLRYRSPPSRRTIIAMLRTAAGSGRFRPTATRPTSIGRPSKARPRTTTSIRSAT